MKAAAFGAALACVVAFPMGAAWQASRSPQPRLVGLGCDFTAGPIYADEESSFPRCDIIRAARLS